MGASVRTEDEAFSDERFADLAMAAGLADADHARGKMERLWRQCTIESVYVLPRETVQRILGDRGVDAVVAARLGEVVDGGVRIRGTKGRIEWLKRLRKQGKFGKKGGRPKKNPPGLPGEPLRVPETPSAETPPAPAPAPAPAQIQIPDPDSVAGATPAMSPRGRSRGAATTPDERSSAMRVLAKLSEFSRVAYRGSDKHLELIARQLRGGVSELELRAVVALQAAEWGDDPKMRKYLRPETLFGPETIEKYLDAARTEYRRELARMEPQPPLELVR